jgi:thiol-disulfide isomerase/thioredoxin
MLKSKKNFGLFSMCLMLFRVAFPVCTKAEPANSGLVPDGALARALKKAGLPAVKPGIIPPDFSLPLLEAGQALKHQRAQLSALKGKVVILNFWATWCPPCRAEMPAMERLYKQYKDKGLTILAVDCQESQATVEKFVTEQGYSFPIALDASGSVCMRYGANAIPTSYILDKKGQVVSRITGGIEWDSPRVTAVFDVLLGAQA